MRLAALATLASLFAVAQVQAAGDGQVLLSPNGNPCVAGRCTLTLDYFSGEFDETATTDQSVTVDVDWDHPGAPSSHFVTDASARCGFDGFDATGCSLHSPVIETVGRYSVAVRITPADGASMYSSQSVNVVTNVVTGDHPPPLRKASHDGWPNIDGMLLINTHDGNRPLDARGGQDPFDRADPSYRCDDEHDNQGCFLVAGACQPGPKTNTCLGDPVVPRHSRRHNELLGAHGSDTIHAGDAGDVIWGDYKPTGQPRSQRDKLFGGRGRDFIYTSYGVNIVHTGGGPDVVHAHDGSGDIFCDSAATVVYMSHQSHRRYRLHGCRNVSFKPAGTAIQ